MNEKQPDTPTAHDYATRIETLIGDLRTPPDRNSPEQVARARIRDLARSIVGAMRAEAAWVVTAQAQAVVDFPQYGAAPGIAAEHLADLVRRLANWPLSYPPSNPELAAAAAAAADVLAGGPGAAAAAEKMRQDDDLARATVLLLSVHVRSIVDHVTAWADAADMAFYDVLDGKDTSLERRHI